MTRAPDPVRPSDKAQAAALRPETVSAGKLQVVSLAAIKDRLGDRWQRASERIRARLEDALRQRMGPGDLFLPLDDTSFVVVFANRSKEQAQLECYAAARDVLAKLFGDDMADIQVRTVAGQLDGGLVAEDVDPRHIVDEALEREGDVVLVEGSSPDTLAEAIVARDVAAAVESKPAPQAARAPVNVLPPAVIGFHPIWSYAKSAVVAYLCDADLLPVVDELGSFETEQQIAKVDGEILDLVERELAAAVKQKRRLMIYCPVHFATLTHWRSGPAYFRRVHGLGPAAAQLLVWIVRGVSRGAPHSRLVECLPRLTGLGRATYCEVDPDDPHLKRFSNLGVRALGFRWSDRIDADGVHAAGTFAHRARAAGFPTFATALDSPASVVIALAAGIAELQGAAVRAPVACPDTAFRLSLIDLYRDAAA
jgi:hypothetical protein